MDYLQRLFHKPKKSPGGSLIQEFAPGKAKNKLRFSDAPSEWQVLRDSKYQKWFGKSANAMVWHEIVPIIPHIDVHIFPPSKELSRDYYTLVTSGMSDQKMKLPKGIDSQYARAELIFYIDEADTKPYQTEKPWFVQAISFYAHFPFNYKTWLGISHTLPNGNPTAPIVEGSLLTTALFLPAIFEPKEFVNDFKLGNEQVNLLWLTYLTDKETEYKLNEGYDRLVDRFNKDNFPQVFNPFRASIV